MEYLKEFGYLAQGLYVTVILTAGAILIGTALAALLALLRMSHNTVVRGVAATYVEFMRGTPLLVQLFIVYFALAPVLQQKTGINITPITAGVVGLGLNAGAYISEIFRGAIMSIPNGQMEAARSLGMGHWLAMRRIVWPQALRHAIPALGSSFAALIKDTSLVSVITVSELLLVAQQRVSFNYRPMEVYLMIGIMYFVLTTIVTYAVRWWERQYQWSI